MLDAETLFRDHNVALFRYLVRLTGDAELAADATQEAFVRLIDKQPANQHLKAWLYRVATNFARESARSGRRQSELAVAAADRLAPDDTPAPDSVTAARRQAALVRTCLARLTERDRTVLLMREQGFTHREIAATVGTTTGSVGTLIARALDRLAGALNSETAP